MGKTAQFMKLGDYFAMNADFVIPNYQRGYKWGVKTGSESSITYLLNDILDSYKKKSPMFLQGITVCEENDNGKDRVILIDGQQRTTSLYLLLWYLHSGIVGKISLRYDVRHVSQLFLDGLKQYAWGSIDDLKSKLSPVLLRNDDGAGKTMGDVFKNDSSQDIHYFIEAIRQIDETISACQLLSSGDERKSLADYILTSIQILYIVVDKDNAVKTFTMMNGSKATMHSEELVKAEVLHAISSEAAADISDMSLPQKLAQMWQESWNENALRSRYAREWDRWLYWWNRRDVKRYFGTEKLPMGWLLKYFARKLKDVDDSYESYRSLIKCDANGLFDELRKLQKTFEDLYSIPQVHNELKLAIICQTDRDDLFEIFEYFIEHKGEILVLRQYANLRLVGVTHLECVEQQKRDEKLKKIREARDRLAENTVYGRCDDLAYKQLLRLNVELFNNLNGGCGLPFDFSICEEHSLEHIYPKSKVYAAYYKDGECLHGADGSPLFMCGDGNLRTEKEIGEGGMLRDEFNDNGSEHCIGNLVLLYGSDNSSFGNKPFDEKKRIFFTCGGKDGGELLDFKSRNLMHSMFAFANGKWGSKEIQDQRASFLEGFDRTYKCGNREVEND